MEVPARSGSTRPTVFGNPGTKLVERFFGQSSIHDVVARQTDQQLTRP